uniref:hypothetical protein n=1 Tax=Polynucleobacter sp. TaxID=2029855 RepID=UPI0040478774
MTPLKKLRQKFTDPVSMVVLLAAIILFVLTVLKARDLLSGEISRRGNPAVKYSMLIESLPKDFNDLLAYLQKAEPLSRNVLWHPLNYANYLIIPDAVTSQGVFLGTSFIREATGQRDYPGFFTLDPRHEFIKRRMLTGDYQPLCRSIWENNINLLVSNNYLADSSFRSRFESFFSNERPFDIYDAQQSKNFIDTFRGAPIASFGKGFDLYKIKSNLNSERVELYESNVENLKLIDWCSRSNTGRLPSNYAFSEETKAYSFNANITDARQLSVVLSEKFGYRYLLTIDSPPADQIESFKYVQLGAKLVVQVMFKETFTGRFAGRFETRAWLERHATAILGFQVIFMALVAAFLVSRHVKKTPNGSQRQRLL